MSNLRVISIVEGTAVDGPGLRTAIYLAGCRHQCPGCHNPSTWDFGAGEEMSVDRIMEIVLDNGFNVTLTGGDPAYSAEALLPLVQRIRRAGLTVWMYTGFTYPQLEHVPGMAQLLPYLEAIVDGPYVEALRDPNLHFRGSSNQNIVYIGTEN